MPRPWRFESALVGLAPGDSIVVSSRVGSSEVTPSTWSCLSRFPASATSPRINFAAEGKGSCLGRDLSVCHSGGMDNDKPAKRGGPTIRDLYLGLSDEQLKEAEETSKGTWSWPCASTTASGPTPKVTRSSGL